MTRLMVLDNGAVGRAVDFQRQQSASPGFPDALEEVCGSLAQQIVATAKVSSALYEIEVRAQRRNPAARKDCRNHATSPLVKNRHSLGPIPYWGRIFALHGRAGIKIRSDASGT